MASKTTKDANAAAAASTTAPSLQSTLAETVRLPCAREYFFQMALTAWGYCRADLSLFFNVSDRYQDKFVEDQVGLIESVKTLPDVQVRLAEATEANEALAAWRQQAGSLSKRLGNAINYAFGGTTKLEAERKLAGLDQFGSPSSEPWGNVDRFLTKANTYLDTKLEVLITAKAAKADLRTQFTETAIGFSAAWADFIAKEKAFIDGTKTLNDGLRGILKELTPMLNDGKVIFEFDPVNRKKFTVAELVKEVRGKHPAGLAGYTYNDLGKGMEGVLVQVEGQPDKSAVTDKSGKYQLSLAKGSFNFIFTAAGMETQVVARTLQAGVTSRQNVTLKPMPVAAPVVEAVPTANKEAAPPPSISEPVGNYPLANAVAEMLEKASVNGKANGVAV
ncbi:MAG: carboxypeptidase-like regulatory domain-containing protein [Saprospiraceae bacterium]|nr:carboxypeptidase-like regulatory domain-containing protein [Saprospiraceae bacterium]